MDSGTWYASATASDDGTKNPSDATSWHVSTSSGWVAQSGVSAICATPSPTPIGGFPDLLALNTLYESTDGPNWATNTYWLSSDTTACDPAWHGLSCGSFEGETRVRAMELNNKVLSGSLPTQFGRLDAAESMYLYDNSITGTIPTEFGNLKEGAILHLQRNSITGTLPTEIGDLGLSTFAFYENSVNGSLPTQLGNMGMLTSFNMYENFVDGQIPTEVGRLPIVDKFVGSYQRFTGQIPTQIGMWTEVVRGRHEQSFRHASDANRAYDILPVPVVRGRLHAWRWGYAAHTDRTDDVLYVNILHKPKPHLRYSTDADRHVDRDDRISPA